MAWNDIFKNMMTSELDELMKEANPDALEEKPDLTAEDDKPEIGRKAVITDPFFTQQSQHTMYKHKMSRLSNKVASAKRLPNSTTLLLKLTNLVMSGLQPGSK